MDIAEFPDKIPVIVSDIEEYIISLGKKHNLSSESIRRHYVMSTLYVGAPVEDDIVEPQIATESTPMAPSPVQPSSAKIASDFDDVEEVDSDLSFEQVTYAKALEPLPHLDCSREYPVSFSFVDSPHVFVRILGEKLTMISDEVSMLPALTPVSLAVGTPVLVQGSLRNGNCILEERQRWRRGVVETNNGSSVDVRLADYGVLIKEAKASKLRPLPLEYAFPPSVYRMTFDTSNQELSTEMRRFNLRLIFIGDNQSSDEYTVLSAKSIVEANGKPL